MQPKQNDVKIATVLGTSRPGSYTSMALELVHDELRHSDVSLDFIDPTEMALPFPGQADTADARQLRDRVTAATGVVLATPEYHGSFSSLLKLVVENLGFPSVLSGKPVALVGVAAGRIGAIKSLEQLRGVCSHVGAIVLPASISIPRVRTVFDENGNCLDQSSERLLRSVATSLMSYIHTSICPRVTLEAIVRGEYSVADLASTS